MIRSASFVGWIIHMRAHAYIILYLRMSNYYIIAIERYFCTPVPYFLLGTLPLMFYGYWQNDLCFWIGLVLTVLVFVINHLMMNSITRTFGQYATVRQVDYVSSIIMGKCKVFSDQECDNFFTMIAELSQDGKFTIDDYIRQINHKLEDKAGNGNAEANYWLGVYHRKLNKDKDHNIIARQFIEKSADLGWEDAKKILKKAQKWA